MRAGLGRLALAVAFSAGCAVPAACAGPAPAGTVSVIGNWSGAEENSFQEVLHEFERETGIHAIYHGSQSLNKELETDVRQGHPPDVAIVSSLGQLAGYAAAGVLKPFTLPGAETNRYGRQWLRWSQDVRPGDAAPDQWYAFVFKADLRSAIWYDPTALRALLGPQETAAMPATWDQLVALQNRIRAAHGIPWCVGMESTPNSGWPGTDWIADILLHQSGVEAYQDWTNGRLPWTSAVVRQAWTTWGSLVQGPGAVAGGTQGALLTNYAAAGNLMFAQPPGCYLDHKAAFVMANYRGGTPPAQPGADFDFFPSPDAGGGTGDVREVSADFATMFNATPQAEKLIQFLASDAAQRIWPGIATGSAFSADAELPPSVYSDDVKRRVAATLHSGTLCFNASDLMPASLSAAFNQAVLAYLSDPARLDALLAQLESLRQQAYSTQTGTFKCGRA
ncbi:ABC transporter substrate-binding protein [Gandjariella thermophila]|uniref:ABC transporter substrate-binding protein n=1 Tax=Gandjariella thermophila TaxID=1931992 RepID=A0A4D4J7N4_9PSEU|nr:ABC transporter substrate-binding protein [Gandjariella thermophila]GDY32661.1 ABC transporter substrate-binding protein [Gandjariella thermophila]